MSPKSDPEPRQPHLGAAQIRLLERLCNAVAVSGDEGEVRLLVLENVRPLADEVSVDALGNVLAIRRARGENASGQPPLRSPLRVMLAAHMDEVGFMLTNDDGDGIFRFELVGGLDERQLVGKPVWIGREHVPGVIGAKPIHLTTAEERKLAISLDSLRMDTGPGGNSKVKVGDREVLLPPTLCGEDRSGALQVLDGAFEVALVHKAYALGQHRVDVRGLRPHGTQPVRQSPG